MKAVLLIHGFATDQNDFAPLVPYLWSCYAEVLCPNLPAHGKVERKSKLNHKRLIEFVLNAFDDLQSRHQSVDVIGFSMGGALAAMLANVRKVNRLILLAPAVKYLAPWFMLNTIKAFSGANRQRRAKKRGKKSDNEFTLGLKDMMGDIGGALKLFFGTIVKRYTPKNVREFARVIRYCNQSINSICCPTLILWGRMDQFVRYASVKQILGYCRHRDTRIIIYPDVSHIMLYSKAKYKISGDILRFLQSTNPPMLGYRGYDENGI